MPAARDLRTWLSWKNEARVTRLLVAQRGEQGDVAVQQGEAGAVADGGGEPSGQVDQRALFPVGAHGHGDDPARSQERLAAGEDVDHRVEEPVEADVGEVVRGRGCSGSRAWRLRRRGGR